MSTPRDEINRMLDLLSRDPAVGTDTALEALFEGSPQEGRDRPSFLESPFLSTVRALNLPQQAVFRPIHQAITGSAPEGDVSGRDILQSAGVPELGRVSLPLVGEVTGRGALGLGMDIVLDPLNLIPIGAGTKLARKSIESIPRLSRLLTRAPEEQAVLDLIREKTAQLRSRSGDIRRGGVALQREIEREAKRTGIPSEKLGGEITRRSEIKIDVMEPKQLDLPGGAASGDELREIQEIETRMLRKLKKKKDPQAHLFPKPETDTLAEEASDVIARRSSTTPDLRRDFVAEKAANLRQQFEDQLVRENSVGVRTTRLKDADLGYVTHIFTKEAKEKLIRASPDLRMLGRKFNARHVFQLTRKFDGSIDELSALAKEGKLPGFEGVVIDKLLVDNPAVISTVRALAGEKAVTDARIYLDAVALLGKKIPASAKLPPSLRRLAISGSDDSRMSVLAGFLKDYAFDPDVAKHLNAYYNAALSPHSPGIMSEYVRMFDKIQDEWKVLTLMPFAAYHFRNFIGNIWNNSLAGIGPSRLNEYTKAAGYMRMAPDATITLGKKQYVKRDLDRIMGDFGITRQFESFLALSDEGFRKTFSEKIPGVGQLVGLGRKLGNVIEDHARITHFFAKLDDGARFRDAALSVKKYLFNYAELSNMEKSVLRRAFPFYSWTRFNLPLQLESLVNRPSRFQALGDIVAAVERDQNAPSDIDRLAADWVKRNSGIIVENDEDGNPRYFLLGGWIPAADINKIANPMWTIFNEMSPFITTAPEIYLNKDAFLGRDIENFPGEKTKFIGIEGGRKLVHVLKNIRLLTELDRMLAFWEERGGLPDITSRQAEDVVSFGIRGLFGGKAYPVDVNRERRRKMFERQELLGKRRSDMRRTGGINQDVIDDLISETTQ